MIKYKPLEMSEVVQRLGIMSIRSAIDFIGTLYAIKGAGLVICEIDENKKEYTEGYNYDKSRIKNIVLNDNIKPINDIEQVSPYSALIGKPIKAKEGATQASDAINSIFRKIANEGINDDDRHNK